MENLLDVFENKTFVTILSIVLALYSAMLAPALPNNVIYFFDTIIGKVLFMFLIGYVASRNVQISLMLVVAFVVTLTLATKNKIIDSCEKDTELENESVVEDNQTDDVIADNTEMEVVASPLQKDVPIPGNNLNGDFKKNYAPYN